MAKRKGTLADLGASLGSFEEWSLAQDRKAAAKKRRKRNRVKRRKS